MNGKVTTVHTGCPLKQRPQNNKKKNTHKKKTEFRFHLNSSYDSIIVYRSAYGPLLILGTGISAELDLRKYKNRLNDPKQKKGSEAK